MIVACLITPNSSILIKNVGINSTRVGFLHIAKMMGANIDVHNKRMEGYEPVADINVKIVYLKRFCLIKDHSWVLLRKASEKSYRFFVSGFFKLSFQYQFF